VAAAVSDLFRVLAWCTVIVGGAITGGPFLLLARIAGEDPAAWLLAAAWLAAGVLGTVFVWAWCTLGAILASGTDQPTVQR
jgi:hypothetical protein